VAKNEISDWYRCLECERVTEVPSKVELPKCPHCGGAVVAVAEPFQTTQFSPRIGGGAKRTAYAGAAPAPKAARSEGKGKIIKDKIIEGLYNDPNSRFQKGGEGYLRVPLDELGAPERMHPIGSTDGKTSSRPSKPSVQPGPSKSFPHSILAARLIGKSPRRWVTMATKGYGGGAKTPSKRSEPT
jgi:DNA-directed RNA polymerase subunit RPC12/RpoP